MNSINIELFIIIIIEWRIKSIKLCFCIAYQKLSIVFQLQLRLVCHFSLTHRRIQSSLSLSSIGWLNTERRASLYPLGPPTSLGRTFLIYYTNFVFWRQHIQFSADYYPSRSISANIKRHSNSQKITRNSFRYKIDGPKTDKKKYNTSPRTVYPPCVSISRRSGSAHLLCFVLWVVNWSVWTHYNGEIHLVVAASATTKQSQWRRWHSHIAQHNRADSEFGAMGIISKFYGNSETRSSMFFLLYVDIFFIC